MAVRPHPTKKGFWIIDFYPQGRKGRRERVPFRGTEAQALAMEVDLRMATKRVKTRLFPRIEEVVPDFLIYYKLDHQPAGYERTLYSFKHLIPFFGKYQFTHVVPTFVEEYKTMRLAHVTPSTINKELAALSSFCRWATEQGYCEPINIKRFPGKLTKAPLPSVPSRDDILKLIGEIPDNRRGVIAAMYYAGLRSSEARFLRRESVFIEKGILVVRGKGNKQRIVPIMQDLIPYLKKGETSGYLWLNPKTKAPWKDIRLCLKGAAKRAEITINVTPHTMRHCFGTHSTEAGVGLRTLQDVMGHSTSQVTEIYTTLAAQHLSIDMQKFSDYSSHNLDKNNDNKTKR